MGEVSTIGLSGERGGNQPHHDAQKNLSKPRGQTGRCAAPVARRYVRDLVAVG
jgi:hypothetical protein